MLLKSIVNNIQTKIQKLDPKILQLIMKNHASQVIDNRNIYDFHSPINKSLDDFYFGNVDSFSKM